MFWKCNFLVFTFFAQNVINYALNRNTFVIFRKDEKFCPRNHQFCNGKTNISSFPKINSRDAELLVFTMPKLVF